MQKKLPLINSAHDSETRNIINELIKLFNGMGYTYDEALQKAHDVLSEAQKTNNMNKDVQAQVNKFISEFESTGETNLEVVQARGDYDVLNKRLDKSDEKLESTKSESFMTKVNNKTVKSAAVFIDDDGRTEVLTELKPIFDAEGIPLTISIISGFVGNDGYMDVNEIKNLENNGWEIASHTVNHPDLKQAGISSKRYEVFESKKQLEAMDFTIHNFVYPYGEEDSATRNFLREAGYNSAPKTMPGIVKIPIDRYRMNRVGMGSYFDFSVADNADSVEYYKQRVDEAFAQGGIVIFKIHCWNASHTATQNQYIQETIQYIKSLGMPIMNLNDAIQQFDNIVDAGDEESGKSTTISTDGTFRSDDVPILMDSSGASLSKPITDYELNKITVNRTTSVSASGFPEDTAGTLETYLMGGYDWGFQIYTPMRNNNIYKRHWDVTQKWSAFEKVTNNEITILKNLNALNSNHDIDKLNHGMTYSAVNAAGGVGMPNNSAGVLSTIKIHNAGWWYQLFKEYNTEKLFLRGTNIDGSKKEWKEIALISENKSESINVGVISSFTTREFITTISSDKLSSSPIVSSVVTLPVGILLNTYVNTGRFIVVRVANITNSNIDCGVMNLNVKLID